MKVPILSRVSTSKQDNTNPVDQLRDFAYKQGWKIVAEYMDTVTDLAKRCGAQFDAMMVATSQRRFESVPF